MPAGTGDRLKLAALTFPTVACVSYAAQRLAALGSEPAVTFAEAHIPYFGRIAFAAVHGVMAGVLVGVLVPARYEPVARWLVPALVLPAALAMAIWP